MYIETVPSRGARPTILLREGHREGRRVVKRTLANLTHWPADKVDRLRRVLRDEPLVPAEQTGRVLWSLPHGHVEAALAVAHRIGLPEILGSRRSPSRDRVLALVVQRVLKPASKLATAELLGTSTLAEELGVTDISEDDLYATMDWLGKRQTWIEKNLAARHLRNGDSALYDASSSYYEGRTCTLMRFGYSRDGKRGRPIVVYGLMTDAAGRPLSIQAYPGDTGDAATVSDQVDKLRGRFGLDQVVLVGDRGMLTQTCIERLRQHPGIGWISALRSDGLRRLVEDRSLQPSLFDERRLAEIASPSFPGERLVVCCNPLLAERRRTQRQRLLKATEEAFQRIVREVERRTRRPLTAVEIARKVGRVENRFKVGKYLRTEIDDGVFRFVRHPDTIQRDAELDGLYACAHQRTGGAAARTRSRAALPQPIPRGAGVPIHEVGRTAGEAHPSPPGTPRAHTLVLVHAVLLSGVASAPRIRFPAVRGRRKQRIRRGPSSGPRIAVPIGQSQEAKPPEPPGRTDATKHANATGTSRHPMPSALHARTPTRRRAGDPSDRTHRVAKTYVGTGAELRPRMRRSQ